MTEEEKDLLLQEMQRQHIIRMEALGGSTLDGSMRLKMSPPFDTGTVSGVSGGRLLNNPYTQPMNLGQGVGGGAGRGFIPPQMPPQQIPRQVPQVPQVPTGLINMNRRNDPLTNALTQTVMPTARQQQRPVPQVPPQVRPDDSRLGTATQGRAFTPFSPTSLPTQVPNMPSPQVPPQVPQKVPMSPPTNTNTRTTPPQGEDRGMFGMTGFFGDLFNDPRRMAMLSGGLTALDPNAYYDKEGFGSPWTGLRSGLGGAQAGYKSVIDRQKAEAETASLGAKGKYQTFEEPTRDGKGVEKVTYFVKPNGDRQVIKRTPILKTASGVNDEGELVGGLINVTEGKFDPLYSKAVKTGNYGVKDIAELNKDYDFDKVIIGDINSALSLVNEQNMGGSGWWDRVVDKGSAVLPSVARFLGKDPSETSEATELVRLFDNLKSTNFKVAMNVALTGKLLDSQRDRNFIEEVLRSPKTVFHHHADLRKNLERLGRVLNRLQRKREATGHIGKSKKSSGGATSNFKDKYKHLLP